MDRKKTVSLCMIVKNEERYLDGCLNSVKSLVDEIIIVDTGSVDNTIEIAKKFQAKIYNYIWDDNFSNARNYSISKATGEWILLLDGDEELDENSYDKFIHFINHSELDGCHFNVYNYMGVSISSNYSVHNAFRLLRNNQQYQFEGEIHEQIRRKDGQIMREKFSVEDIIIHHYGYLDYVAKEKNKRNRNIPILMKQVEREPKNSFYLFNLGNEYLAQGNYQKTIELYNKAYSYIDKTEGYAPHLIYRRAMCFYHLKQYEHAVESIEEGLKTYPRCTDLEYLKGVVFVSWNRYTLAIDSFNKCIQIGEAPSSLKFINGCGTYRPYISLGELYLQLDDYHKALDSFVKAINADNTLHHILYKIGETLNKMYKDKKEVKTKLASYFSDLNYLPNLIVFLDILIKQGLYNCAYGYIGGMNRLEGNDADKRFINAKIHFYLKEYNKAFDDFYEIVKLKKSILPYIQQQSCKYLFVTALIHNPESLENILDLIQLHNNDLYNKIYSQFYNVYVENDEIVLLDSDNENKALAIVTELLEEVLRVQEFDLFEKLLYVFNAVKNNRVLLYLAKLYYDNEYKSMAVKQIIRSIKELGVIDAESVCILCKEIR